MNQEDQSSRGIQLPIELHVADTVHNQYVHNIIVQPGAHEITIFFFETQIPPFIGSPQENKEHLQKLGSIRFECVSKITVAPQLVPEMIKALQGGLDNYNAAQIDIEGGER